MRKLTLLFLLFLVLAYGFQVEVVDIRFSPRGGCTQAVVQKIDEAQREIKIMIYSFTSEPIASALLRAPSRGVGDNHRRS